MLNYIQEHEEEYNRQRRYYLTAHSLADFQRCPREYHRRYVLGEAPEREDTPAFLFGRAFHAYVLEPATFHDRFAVGGPINPKTGRPFGADTKAFAEWAALSGKPVLPEDKYLAIKTMAEAIAGHAEAARLLETGMPEQVLRADMQGTPCQARLDWIRDGMIVDLKTCEDLDHFENDACRFNYAHQMAFYHMLTTAAGAGRQRLYLIVAEKQEWHRVGVWEIGSVSLEHGIGVINQALENLRRCLLGKQWPTGYEEVKKL